MLSSCVFDNFLLRMARPRKCLFQGTCGKAKHSRIAYTGHREGAAVSSLTSLILPILVLPCILFPITSPRAQAQGQSSDQSEVLLADAKSLFQLGKFTEADRTVREYLEKHPDSADGHFLLGHILFREIQSQGKAQTNQSPGTSTRKSAMRRTKAGSSRTAH